MRHCSHGINAIREFAGWGGPNAIERDEIAHDRETRPTGATTWAIRPITNHRNHYRSTAGNESRAALTGASWNSWRQTSGPSWSTVGPDVCTATREMRRAAI